MHGGRAAIGPLNPRATKNGKYSKYVPGRLLSAYQDALNDPVLSGLQDELALCDSRLRELVTTLEDASGPGQTMIGLRNLFSRLSAELGEQPAPIQKTLETVEDLITKGLSSEQVWGNLLEVIEQRRRCSETENRRIVAMNQAIPIKKVVELVSLICSSIRQHVVTHATPSIAERILRDSSRDVQRIVGANHIKPVEPESDSLASVDPFS